jgi:hypothetical protein
MASGQTVKLFMPAPSFSSPSLRHGYHLPTLFVVKAVQPAQHCRSSFYQDHSASECPVPPQISFIGSAGNLGIILGAKPDARPGLRADKKKAGLVESPRQDPEWRSHRRE